MSRWLAALACLASAACASPDEPAAQATAAVRGEAAATSGSRLASRTRPAPAEPVSPAERGFVVWESNRSGAWRIWRRDLAGGPATQLTRDERARHCCPHLSPDGARIAYLSLPGAASGYPGPTETGMLRVLVLATGEERVVAERARTYLENRAAVWHGPGTLSYIDAQGRTVATELATGRTRSLVEGPLGDYGWLVSSTGAYATRGLPSFSPLAPQRRVAEREPFGGCQPYFSHDGRWGFWTAGAGGPIRRIDLGSRATDVLLAKADPRLSADRPYLYFPMLSADGRWLAFGASGGEHDHHEADYDVFVVETDPQSLTVVGEPVRVTEHPSTDRYPDVWAEPLTLGLEVGEAPFEVELEAPADGRWSWKLGDGSEATGRRVRHSYPRPGRYDVVATLGDVVLRGLVRVAPPTPPEVETTFLRAGGARVVVRFSEAVTAVEPSVEVELGRVSGWSLDAAGRELAIELEEPVRRPTRLAVSGFSDQARPPNAMAPATVQLEPARWPAGADGLLLVWQTGRAANLVHDPEVGGDRAVSLVPAGRAHLDHDGAMVVDAGYFAASKDEANRLRWALQRTNELTLELRIHPAVAEQAGAIVSFASGGARNFVLEQEGRALRWTLRVGSPRRPEPDRSILLPALPAHGTTHVTLAYSPGHLTVWYDGRRVLDTGEIQGDFYHFRSLAWTLGAAAGGGSDWAGTLEGLAVWDRTLSGDEAAENAARYEAIVERRASVERWVARARPVAASRTPSLQEIEPYREALRVVRYEVVEWVEGEPLGSSLRVAEWALLGGETIPPPTTGATAAPVTLILERFEDNPQLAPLVLSDTLDDRSGSLLTAVRR